MKIAYRFVLVFIMLLGISAQGQIIGKWKSIDDETGKEKSIVEVYKQDGKIFGKIIKIIDESLRDKVCNLCEGEQYNKPIQGMVVMKNLEKDGDEYDDGTILDPKNGKVYRCKIWIDESNPNILNVRGYIAFLFRTQQWIRI